MLSSSDVWANAGLADPATMATMTASATNGFRARFCRWLKNRTSIIVVITVLKRLKRLTGWGYPRVSLVVEGD